MEQQHICPSDPCLLGNASFLEERRLLTKRHGSAKPFARFLHLSSLYALRRRRAIRNTRNPTRLARPRATIALNKGFWKKMK